MKKSIHFILIITIISVFLTGSISAKEKIESKMTDLDYICDVVSGGSIIIDGVENELYDVFENQETALKKFKEIYNEFLDYLKKENNLEELNENNYILYVNAWNNQIEEGKGNKYILEGTELNKFIDIFENAGINENIRNIYEKKIEKDIKMELLATLLPYDTPLARKYIEANSTMSVSYTRSSLINYASTYAFSANTAYRYLNSDCTNFASQALYTAGVSMNYTGNKSTGWWCNSTSITNYCSYSWSFADNFCDRFGMYYQTNSHSGFSSNLTSGSIIALDFEGDGSWDHVGIVTSVATAYSSSLGYKDYKVAQHSSCYEAWTSSNINNWETYESGLSIRYGIVLH